MNIRRVAEPELVDPHSEAAKLWRVYKSSRTLRLCVFLPMNIRVQVLAIPGLPALEPLQTLAYTPLASAKSLLHSLLHHSISIQIHFTTTSTIRNTIKLFLYEISTKYIHKINTYNEL